LKCIACFVLALPSDNGGSEVTALLLEADDGKGTVLYCLLFASKIEAATKHRSGKSEWQ